MRRALADQSLDCGEPGGGVPRSKPSSRIECGVGHSDDLRPSILRDDVGVERAHEFGSGDCDTQPAVGIRTHVESLPRAAARA